MVKWKFWKKDKTNDDDTIITCHNSPGSKQIYVAAKSSKTALDIYNELKGQQ